MRNGYSWVITKAGECPGEAPVKYDETNSGQAGSKTGGVVGGRMLVLKLGWK
jgi:hypothetical protein